MSGEAHEPKQHTPVSAERNKALSASRLKWDDYCHSRSDISKLGLRLCKTLATKYVCKSKSAATFAATGVMVVNPSQLGLATELNCSRLGLRKVIRNLIKVGVLRIRSKGGVGGRGTNTEYEMIFPAQEGATKGVTLEHKEGATKGQLLVPERGNSQAQEGVTGVATISSLLLRPSLINSPRVAPTKKKNVDALTGSVSSPVAPTPPTYSNPVDLQALEKLWPRKNQDASALSLVWKRVVASGVDPAYVLKQADRWCLWWSSTGAPANKVPHLGQWLSSGAFRKKPPFDASYPEGYARMLRRMKVTPVEHEDPEPIKPCGPQITFAAAAALNLDLEDGETRRRVNAEILQHALKPVHVEQEAGGMFLVGNHETQA